MTNRIIFDTTASHNYSIPRGINRVTCSLLEHTRAIQSNHTYSIFFVGKNAFTLAHQNNTNKNTNKKSFTSKFLSEIIYSRLMYKINESIHNNKILKYIFLNTSKKIKLLHLKTLLHDAKQFYFKKNDILILSDPLWRYLTYENLNDIKIKGVKIVWFCHDIMPVTHRSMCSSIYFNNWFFKSSHLFNAIICNSKYTKSSLLTLHKLSEPKGIFSQNASVHYIHLSSNFKPTSQLIPSLRDKSVFLTISSIDKRKNHQEILDAAEILWDIGQDFKLIWVGTWNINMYLFRKKILSHPEYNKRLFIPSDISDEKLQNLYASSTAMISASITEGFGLPIVEAQNFGLPAILSDIPAHREIADSNCDFYTIGDRIQLAEHMVNHMKYRKKHSPCNEYSWQESALKLISILDNL